MTHLSRVLVGVDFSKPARRAFEYALALSRRHRAELIVVQAVPTDQPFAQHGRARLALAEKLRHAAAAARVGFTHRVQTGDPAEIILLHSRSVRPDVIVVGTHQRSGIRRLRERSVAGRVAATATVPVLVVPPHRRHSGPDDPFRHVAVAIDFGPASNRAIEHALALASDAADRVTLLHVTPGFSADVPPHLYGYGLEEDQDPRIRDARQRLQRAVPATPHAGLVDVQVLRGDVTTEIARAVDRIGAELLVAGVPRRGVISRALFGSTVARLLRVVGVPVLAVPGDDVVSAGRKDANRLPQAA